MKIDEILKNSADEVKAGLDETASKMGLVLADDERDEVFKIAHAVAMLIHARFAIDSEQAQALFSMAVVPVFSMLKVMKTDDSRK